TAVKGAFKQGVASAGGMKVAFGKTPSAYEAPVSRDGEIIRELYYRMYLKHDENWIGGGGYKLSRVTTLTPGWAQPFIGHLWSGNSGDPKENYLLLDPASGTDEAGNLLTTKYNDFDNLRWLDIKQGLTPIFSEDYIGKWYSIEVHIKLNDPGQSNGVFEYWINNTLQASKTNINWVGNYDAYGINTVLFENFWNNGAPQDQNRYFDNIVISTEKIDKDMEVNPAGVSGGNAELGWSAPDGLVEGEDLIVTTDGTFDFGDLGPTMLYRQTLSDETSGTALSLNNPVGRGTVVADASGTPTVAAVSELPYGKGLEIGTPIKKFYVLDNQTHTEYYEHYYLYWPAEHQDNSYSDLQTWTEGWGVKGIWHYLDSNGYARNNKSDIYTTTPGWYSSGKYFTPGYKYTSNDSPISTGDRTASGILDPNDRTRWRSAPLVRQLWVKSGPIAGSAVDSDGLYRLTDTSFGMVTDKDYAGTGLFSANDADPIGFDRISVPGHVGGLDINKQQHLYYADIYQAVGPGA
ncbi:polysaccharide lyase, partial [Paenibacillus sp. MY03]|uniref:polysaccharide lyase n=1 Tax=Paenibacillus sp. MY03 TaxID=302980 RepID=UPI0015C5B722